MNDKFQVGDIVEVLNLTKEQIYGIQSQTCISRNEKQLIDSIVGTRYFVEAVFLKDDFYKYDVVSLLGWGHGGRSAHLFAFSQVALYRRAEMPDITSDDARAQCHRFLRKIKL